MHRFVIMVTWLMLGSHFIAPKIQADTELENKASSLQEEHTTSKRGQSVEVQLTIADGEKKLNYIDSLRGYGEQGFSFNLTNVSYRQQKKQTLNQLTVKVLNDQSLVEYLSPKRQMGRKILKQGSNMWMHIPGTRNILRITPAQRLIGQASNGDVTGTTFSNDYDVVAINQTELQGNKVFKLELAAKRVDSAYQQIVFYINAENDLPISSEFYSRTKRLLKRAEYREFKQYGEQLKIHKMLLSDPINKGNFTWMKFEHYRKHEINPVIFHKDSLLR